MEEYKELIDTMLIAQGMGHQQEVRRLRRQLLDKIARGVWTDADNLVAAKLLAGAIREDSANHMKGEA